MTITIETTRIEQTLSTLLEAARGESQGSDGHFHIKRPYECTEPGCLGIHPAVALARACRRTERQARQLIQHRHSWEPFLNTSRCSTCGQLYFAKE